MITARQLVTDALVKAGVVSDQDILSSQEANDGLRALNDLFENLSLERQSVYMRQPQTFRTVAGKATYTIGPGGDWLAVRPARIDSSSYVRMQGIDFPLEMLDDTGYSRLSYKAQPGIPARYVYRNDAPLASLTFWPVPDDIYDVTLLCDRVLAAVPTLDTVLVLPTGYGVMLKCLLAEMLAPEYGVQLPQAVADQAQKFKADVKRANRRSRTARFDDVPGVMGAYDWRTGG